MSAEKGTERVADTAMVIDADFIADTDAEDGECEEVPARLRRARAEPDKETDEKKSETAPKRRSRSRRSRGGDAVPGRRRGLGARYSSDDVLHDV